MSDAEAARRALSATIRAHLAGHDPIVQGAVLADLLSMWLAGHVVEGDDKATERLRRDLLKVHVAFVKGLIPINFKIHIEPKIKGGSP